MSEDCNVKVALRIRPQSDRERLQLSKECIAKVPDEQQIVLGRDRFFTFDYVFDTATQQPQIYSTAVSGLVRGCFDGKNATVLAYGQTGSGKTYTMGTAFDKQSEETLPHIGVIPRAVDEMFAIMEKNQNEALAAGLPIPEYSIEASFVELHNEELKDLLNPSSAKLQINDFGESVTIKHLQCKPVASKQDVLDCLRMGTLARTTQATAMNAVSSRSHAIFTIYLTMKKAMADMSDEPANSSTTTATTPPPPVEDSETGSEAIEVANGQRSSETPPVEANLPKSSDIKFQILRSKFHFVDLAGSERLNRTKAVGERAKEGIKINEGLLYLGNVISALGDVTKKGGYVNYRDSKLTQLLKDSLGGNSRTLMIACVSPSDIDFNETLNTLQYANRARNIKNKVVINQDSSAVEIAMLRQQIQNLKLQVYELRSGLGNGSGGVGLGPHGDILELAELQMLREDCARLTAENAALQTKLSASLERTVQAQAQLELIRIQRAAAVANMDTGLTVDEIDFVQDSSIPANEVLEYVRTIEDLRNQLAAATIASTSSATRFNDSPLSSKKLHRNLAHKKSVKRKVAFTTALFTDEQPRQNDSNSSVPVETDLTVGDLENGYSNSSPVQNGHELADDTPTALVQRSKRIASESDDEDNIDEDAEDEDAEDTEEMAKRKSDLHQKLENSQRLLETVKSQYEHQLSLLQRSIREREAERDLFLQNLEAKASSTPEEKSKATLKFKQDLTKLENELAKQKKQWEADRTKRVEEIDRLHTQMENLKREKVQLTKKVREQMKEKLESDALFKRNVEKLTSQLEKSQFQYKKLENDAAQHQLALKRAREDLMRKQQRLADAPSIRLPTAEEQLQQQIQMQHSRGPLVMQIDTSAHSVQREAKKDKKLVELEKLIPRLSLLRESQIALDILHRKRNKLTKQLDEMQVVDTEDALDQREAIEEELKYVTDRVQIEQNALAISSGFQTTMQNLVHNCTPYEARQILEAFVNIIVDVQCADAQKAKQQQQLQQQPLVQLEPLATALPANGINSWPNMQAIESPVFNGKRGGTVLVPDTPPPPLHPIQFQLPLASQSPRDPNVNNSPSSSTISLTSTTPTKDTELRPRDVFARLANPTKIASAEGEWKTVDPQAPNSSLKTAAFSLNCAFVATGHLGPVTVVAATQDRMFSGSADGTVKVWDLGAGKDLVTLNPTAGETRDLCYIDNRLFTSSPSHVRIWDINTSSVVRTMSFNAGEVGSVLVDGSYNHLYVVEGKAIHVYDLRKPSVQLFTMKSHTGKVHAIHSVGSTIVSGGKDHETKVFNKDNGDLIKTLEPVNLDGVMAIAACGDFLFSGIRNKTLARYRIANWSRGTSYVNAHQNVITSLGYLSSMNTLLSADKGGYMKFWEPNEVTSILDSPVMIHDGAVNSIFIHRDRVYTASADKTVKIWNVQLSE